MLYQHGFRPNEDILYMPGGVKQILITTNGGIRGTYVDQFPRTVDITYIID